MTQPLIGAYSQRFMKNVVPVDAKTKIVINANPGVGGSQTFTLRTLYVGWNGAMGKVTGSGNYRYGNNEAPANSGVATANSGDTVTLTATPDDGYYFVHWQGGPVDGKTDKTVTITMNDNYSVTAVFAATADNSGNNEQGTTSSNTSETLMQKATAFVMKWWWAILIVGYILYKEWKGGKE